MVSFSWFWLIISHSCSQQVAERWPLFFVCPSFTPWAPREFSQRDPRNVLLPGGRDVSQPCFSHQLALCSPSLYEESLLQHWDHVSKRNKFVGSRAQTWICTFSLCERLNLKLWNKLGTNLTNLWIQTSGVAYITKTCSHNEQKIKITPHISWAKEVWFKELEELYITLTRTFFQGDILMRSNRVEIFILII